MIQSRAFARVTVTFLAVALAAACTSDSGPAEQAAPSGPSSIVGVWAFVSDTNTETGELVRDDSTWSGIWIFTDGYHCLARMQDGRVASTSAELEALEPAERIGHYEQLLNYSSTAGSYVVEGDTLLREWQISLGPTIIGIQSVATYSVEDNGDRLIVNLPRRSPDSGASARVVYRRLE